MAKRPIEQKKLRRLRKLLRAPLPAYIDLVHWLKLHGYAQTSGEAERIILAGRVKADSHTLGIAHHYLVDGHEVPYVAARVRADLKERIVVTTA